MLLFTRRRSPLRLFPFTRFVRPGRWMGRLSIRIRSSANKALKDHMRLFGWLKAKHILASWSYLHIFYKLFIPYVLNNKYHTRHFFIIFFLHKAQNIDYHNNSGFIFYIFFSSQHHPHRQHLFEVVTDDRIYNIQVIYYTLPYPCKVWWGGVGRSPSACWSQITTYTVHRRSNIALIGGPRHELAL